MLGVMGGQMNMAGIRRTTGNNAPSTPAFLQQTPGSFALNTVFSTDRHKETIHSGHFMVSNVPQDEEDDNTDEGVDIEGIQASASGLQDVIRAAEPGPSFVQTEESLPPGRQRANSDPMRDGGAALNITHRKVIDSSLSKLFECMTLAYKAKLTSPKWNNFKGLKLRWTIKIRLNNIIWRAWHMQFVKQVRPLIAPFAIEVDAHPHAKDEAVVLEGKYWKRRLSMVSAEYRRWRVWYRDRASGVEKKRQLNHLGVNIANFNQRLERGEPFGLNDAEWTQQPCLEEMSIENDDFFPADFTDALLARLTNQPFAFPNSREIAQAGYADFIQPGLLAMQPNLEDFMDTLEPLQEFFSTNGSSNFGSQYSNYGLANMDNSGMMSQGMQNCMQDTSMLTMSNEAYSMIPSNNYWRPTIADLTNTQQTSQPPPPAQSPFLNNIQNFNTSTQYTAQQPQQNTRQTYNSTSDNNNSMYQVQNNIQTESNAYNQLLRPTLHVSQSVVESGGDASSAMKQRSLSGPVRGQPLIDASVLSLLAGRLSRPTSASSSSLASHEELKRPLGSSPVGGGGIKSSPVKKMARTKEMFVVPQAAPVKGRRSSKNVKAVEEATRNAMQPPPICTTTNYTSSFEAASGNSSVSLAQLLTGVRTNPFSQQSSVQLHQIQPTPSSPQVCTILTNSAAKKLAPKTSPVTNFSASTAAQKDAGPSQAEPIVPKIEFMGSHDSGFRFKADDFDKAPRNVDTKRINHITAEQKRRGHIKSGFEVLHSLVPSLAQSSSAKVSKAVVLLKGAEHIRQLKEERKAMHSEMEILKQQIETINQAVVACQQKLPATGAPIANRARNDRMNDMLDEYIRQRTLQNWKFWLFSHVMKPLFESYCCQVSTRSMDDLCQSTVSWVDQQCTLVHLRPLIKESMRKLSTTTHVLSDPARLPDEARQAVHRSSSMTSLSSLSHSGSSASTPHSAT